MIFDIYISLTVQYNNTTAVPTGEPSMASSTATLSEAVISLVAHLHKSETWQKVVSSELAERLGGITQYMQVYLLIFCSTISLRVYYIYVFKIHEFY